MAKARMTGKDYHTQYDEIKKSEKSLRAHVDQRLRELLKLYPDSIVSKVSRLGAKDVTENWLSTMSVELQIHFICGIEEWSAEQQNVIQLKI